MHFAEVPRPRLRCQAVRLLARLFLILLLASTCLHSAAADAPRPNVVFILADDLGIGNVGCYGADRDRTPRLDQLASGGIRFTRSFTASLCGPSRALIMSGRYAFRNGATNQDACTQLDPSEIRLPRLFKNAGYATACVGKWGQLPGDPGDHGFDDWLCFKGSGVYLNQPGERPERYEIHGEERELKNGEYMPEICQQRVLQFIARHRQQPFFVYYPMSAVHGDLMPVPGADGGSGDLMQQNIAFMDRQVGQLVDELERLNLRNNTLLIFMGDNGTGKGQADRSTIGGRPISGAKGSMLEGGGLVPLIVSWPARCPQGKVCSDLVDSTDFIPTFAALCGGEVSSPTPLDGQSLAPLLQGQAHQPRRWVFNQLARSWYVRNANWKLNEKDELYDMSMAPFEEPLITTDSEASASARSALKQVLAQLNPGAGVVDQGDGSGRHASKTKKKKAKP